MSEDMMNDLLDLTLDDIDDLPEFKVFPVGVYNCSLTLSTKTINEHPAVEASFVMKEVVELADENDEAPKEGDISSVAFMLDNEFGAGKFKAIAKPLAELHGTGKLREIVEQTKDVDVTVMFGQRVDKTDKTKVYADVKELQVL